MAQGRPALLCCWAMLAFATPALGQLPDALARHFGASRTRESGPLWSAGGGAMLLTEYGSRWWDGLPPTLTDYGDLDVTVGYTYFSLGRQLSWTGIGPGGTLVFGIAGTAGQTSDKLTEAAQDGLHNFRRYPHVQRLGVDTGQKLLGLEAEVSYWWSFRFWGMDLDLFPQMAGIYSGYHREGSLGAGLGLGFWKLRLQGSATKGWLYGSGGVRPTLVAQELKGSYHQFSGSVAMDRTRYGGLARYFPSGGLGVTYSSGIFKGESEFLLSLFFDFPSYFPNHSVRIETVNDLLKGKDRGPTGGLRLTYVAR